MNVYFNIDTSAVVKHANTLEKIRRSALPAAVRETLNKAAFNIKQRTMPVSADKHFEKRSPNFFKANSKVQKATGFDVKNMESIVGFISHNLKYNNNAVRELQQQEYSGTIPDRSFIPTDEARRGGNATPVRPINRLRAIREQVRGGNLSGIVEASKMQGRSRKEQYIRAAWTAGHHGFFIAGIRSRMLYRVEKIEKMGNRTKVVSKAIYSFKSGRKVKVDATGFMREASLKSANQLNKFFVEEAERLISKIRG